MVTSANDYTRLGVVHADTSHDYAAYAAYCADERNWFKRARGEWPEKESDERQPD